MNDQSQGLQGYQSLWGENLWAGSCDQCNSQYILPLEPLTGNCPTCVNNKLMVYDPSTTKKILDEQLPELIIPPSLSPATIMERIKQFLSGLWFAPSDLTIDHLNSRIILMYIPLWLVDTEVDSQWWAETGFNYEIVSHQDYYDENRGGWFSREIKEPRIRWEPRLGTLHRTYLNLALPALEDHSHWFRALGYYDEHEAKPFEPKMISSAFVHLPNRGKADSWPDALPRLQEIAGSECKNAAGANHIRDFRWTPKIHNQNWTLMLVPIFRSFYLDDENQPCSILINGKTGQISGDKRASMKRAQRITIWTLIAAFLLLISSLIGFGISIVIPAGLLLAAGLLILAIVTTFLAFLPPLIVWRINHQNPIRDHS